MTLKIGMIGLDTSHVEIFTKLLHEKKYHFGSAKVTIGCPFPSYDLDLSINRVEEYTSILQNEYSVEITDSVEGVAEKADAIMITAVDGRTHLDLFKRIVSYGKPVFIDKPLAMSEKDAKEIYSLSKRHNSPVMSSSSLRYAKSLQTQLAKTSEQAQGIYLSGPLPFIEKMPYYFWYGIHMLEMLFAITGPNYKQIHVHGNESYDVISIEFDDGRFGIIRGDHNWHGKFEAMLHYKDHTVHLPVYKDEKPYYACLLEQVVDFFETGVNLVPEEETLAIIRFIEEANQKRMVI
ncbi:Gfo/Idh/MocA family protein [Virgibacillus doumboii]|uniref:Gfo/Idh/MocA family protein n=1 Tax=Virgibacillus doumboii TaxID=2697503 RepID=UPI0013E03D8B|nr:Gfo/Idh/MocA family oxidoreductase [Virgibacillus doumboii]